MSEQTEPDGLPEEMPTIEADRPKSKTTPLLVAGMLAIGVVVVAGSVMMKRDSSGTIRREAEEFALRSAKAPTPPAPARASLPHRATEEVAPASEQRADPETERRIQEMAGRLAEADAQARAEAQAKEKEAAKKAVEDAKKRLQARRHSGLTFASSQADQDAAKAPAPSSASVNPFERLIAQREALLAAHGGNAGLATSLGSHGAPTSENAPYGFLPSLKAARPETVAAGYFGDPGLRINQGKFIAGVLETAINSNLPGMVRAVVKHDVYAEDGSSVLIPAGSRIVGEYRSGLVRGQSRVAVIWHRVSRPDGVDVVISSPGADALGVSGLTGQVDTHFWGRFGGSILLSLIDVYAKGQKDESVQVLASDGHDAAGVALQNSINIPPTVHVDQGSAITVFVAQDLDFSRVGLRTTAARP